MAHETHLLKGLNSHSQRAIMSEYWHTKGDEAEAMGSIHYPTLPRIHVFRRL